MVALLRTPSPHPLDDGGLDFSAIALQEDMLAFGARHRIPGYQCEQAKKLAEAGRTAEAIALLEDASAQGHLRATRMLGDWLQEDPPQHDRALGLLRQAANAGSIPASYLLANDEPTIRAQGPKLLEGVPARYDAMAVLSNLDVPQLWILGGKDRDAPPAETLRRLARLQAAGKPIATAVFPDAEHGMYEFDEKPDGERISTRQPDGYFRMMRDFIEGRPLAPAYGDARVSPSP